jgi:hypothetical protein
MRVVGANRGGPVHAVPPRERVIYGHRRGETGDSGVAIRPLYLGHVMRMPTLWETTLEGD